MKLTLLDYLEDTAKKYPDKMAFSDISTSISWKDFVFQAKRKSAIISNYFKPGAAVPVMIEKSVLALEYFFGALYSGCFYSYIDSSFPNSRIESMLKTLGAEYIITDSCFENKVGSQTIKCLLAKDFEQKEYAYSDVIRRKIVDTDPAYANFTSGSTGVPKAVVVSHRSVIDFISVFTEIFEISAVDNIANQAPFDFDVSVKDIFSAIFTGASVHLVPKIFFSFPSKLLDFLEEREVTILIWAVSALCIISTLNGFEYKVPSKLKKIMFSGEVMPIKQLKSWMRNVPDAEYINLYGPTEITCNCSYFRVPKNADLDKYENGVPMGIPFPNERIFLLDEDSRLITKCNNEGEVCVSGTCVALGYYNSEKTSEVFVQNPNNDMFYERIYKTGDLAMLGEDGLYYYLGRKDTQVKHMGHRIELGEIENLISRFDNITRACCVFANNKIIAFYIGKETQKKEIITFLKALLPVYMIPFDFVNVRSFPLTKNGKIDKNALLEGVNG